MFLSMRGEVIMINFTFQNPTVPLNDEDIVHIFRMAKKIN